MDKLKIIVAGISSLILTVGIARFSYTPILPMMKTQINLSDVSGGWLAAINYMGYFSGALTAVSLKSLSQKYYFYRISLLVALITTFLMGITTQPVLWGIIRYISGVSSVAGLTLASGLILHWLTLNQHKKELGLHFSGLGMGIFVSGIIFIFFEKTTNWNHMWMIYSAFGILFYIPAWFWMPKPQITSNAHNQTNTLKKLVSKKWMTLMLTIYFCAGFGFVISATFIVDMLRRLETFKDQGAIIWILVGLAGIPATYLWDFTARKTGQLNTLIIAYLLQIVSFLIPAFTDKSIPNIIGALLFGSTFVGIVSLTLTFIGNKFPENPAKAMSKLTLTYGLAQIFAPVLSGYLLKTTGTYTSMLFITAAVLFTGVFLIFFLKKQESAHLQQAEEVNLLMLDDQ